MSSTLKTKKDSKWNFFLFLLSFLPIFLFLFYKQGIFLYQKRFLSFLGCFKILFPLGILILIWWGISKVRKESYRYSTLELSLLLFISLPAGVNLWINFLFTCIFFLLLEFFPKLEKKGALSFLLYRELGMLFLSFIGKLNYFNIYEASVLRVVNLSSLFLGFESGGLGTTSILFLLVSFLILTRIPSYKKEIPILTWMIYFVFMCMGCFFHVSFQASLTHLVQSSFLFVSMFIATFASDSPMWRKEKVIYSCFLGVLSYLLCFYFPYEGAYIGCLGSYFVWKIVQFIKKRIDK